MDEAEGRHVKRRDKAAAKYRMARKSTKPAASSSKPAVSAPAEQQLQRQRRESVVARSAVDMASQAAAELERITNALSLENDEWFALSEGAANKARLEAGPGKRLQELIETGFPGPAALPVPVGEGAAADGGGWFDRWLVATPPAAKQYETAQPFANKGASSASKKPARGRGRRAAAAAAAAAAKPAADLGLGAVSWLEAQGDASAGDATKAGTGGAWQSVDIMTGSGPGPVDEAGLSSRL